MSHIIFIQSLYGGTVIPNETTPIRIEVYHCGIKKPTCHLTCRIFVDFRLRSQTPVTHDLVSVRGAESAVPVLI